MKLSGYTSTPGLDRFPQTERFAVYCSAHKRLIREDETYRRRWTSYIAAVVCLAIIPIVGWIALAFVSARQQKFQNRRIGELLGAST